MKENKIIPTTSFEKECSLWYKGDHVVFKDFPMLKGVVEEEGYPYLFVLWPGEERAHAIHASEILPDKDGDEQLVSPINEEDPPTERSHAVLYRGGNYGIFLAAKVSSLTQAHGLSRALTAATGEPHWVDPLDAIVQTEGSNRVYWI